MLITAFTVTVFNLCFAKINAVILYPCIGFIKNRFPSEESIGGINKINGHTFTFISCIDQFVFAFEASVTPTPRNVGITFLIVPSALKNKLSILTAPVLIEVWREIIMMIKQVPLIFKFNNRLMISPAFGRFIHNYTGKLKGP